jgi:hypothetical protein
MQSNDAVEDIQAAFFFPSSILRLDHLSAAQPEQIYGLPPIISETPLRPSTIGSGKKLYL